jgi:EmrB/QacA subfamily drug resistance transporter
VNVALPAIEDDLGGGLALQQWVVDAYLLTLGSLILVGGSLGDIFGARRMFALGVAAFGVTSALCAAAPDGNTLIVARGLQGVAGALLTPASLAVIVATFPRVEERGAAIGTWTAWTSVGPVIGPLVGGWLVEVASWRAIFVINIPLALATLGLVVAAMPRRPQGRREVRIDWVGAVLCVVGLGAPVYALIEQPRLGWDDPAVVGALVGGVGVFALFLLWERRQAQPMLPLRLFASRNFSAANLATFGVYAGLSIFTFFLVLQLQQVAGWSALESGFALLPISILLFALSRRVGLLSARLGPRLFMTLGPLVGAAGILLLLRVDDDVSYAADVLPGLVVFSLGFALTVAPLTSTVLADAGERDAGIASGVNNAVARVAGLLGIAVLGVVVGSQVDTEAFHMSAVIAAALVAAGGLVSAVGIRNP